MDIMNTKIFWLFLGASALLLCPGCMVGPKYSRPQTAADTESDYYRAGAHSQDVNDFNDVDRWWEQFGDATIGTLVNRALEKNNDLKAAAARVLQAQAAFRENSGRRWPEVSYNLNRDRSKRSFNFGGRFSVITTTWTQELSVTYILDFFGRLRRLERAAWNDMLAAEANEQALINSIIASVIKARVDIATLQRRLAIERGNIESRRKTLAVVEQRYEQGLVGPVDVRLARENLAAAKAVEADVERSLATAHHALDVLLARRPASSPYLPETLPDLPDLEPIPLGLPVALLDRRPDIRAAEMSLRAANERIGVSIAQLYPDVTLVAGWGRSADRWRDIWKDETEIYSALLRLAQPIFKGGQLRAQVDASKARYAEAAAVYSGIVLTALREVEDALISEQMLQRQLKHVEVRLREADAAEQLSRERYQRGVEAILTVLESERRRRLAENELAILKGLIWTNRVNIHLALGGDWGTQEETKG
ncbi:MAG TPA: efflux transporter outer membrane subunit [Sedimentisphaerales bacterium]|nr:efflux transporter outer membrane subunit [Sedimentisphaerales bacterium]